jgi:hypothetical protein
MRTDKNAASFGFTLAGRALKGVPQPRSGCRAAAETRLRCPAAARRHRAEGGCPAGFSGFMNPNRIRALRQWSFVEPLLG